MSNMDQVMKEISGGAEENTNASPATPNTEPPQETAPAVEPSKADEQPEAKPKPKKDLSKVSDKDKAAYSFQKQLERQRKNSRKELEDLMESKFGEFSKKFTEDFNASHKPPEEKPKTRDDFDSDTAYVNYMIQEGIKKALADRDAAHAKTAAEQEEARKKAEAARADSERMGVTFAQNIQAIYEGDELEGWKQRVAVAAQKGLKDVLEASPILKSFVMTSKWGPLVLDKIITDPDTLKRIRGPFSSPVEFQMELASIASEARAERAGKGEEQPKGKAIHPMGRPGAGNGGGSPSAGVFSSDDALIKFMRKGGRR